MKVAAIFRNPEALLGQHVEVEGLWLISNTDYFMWLVVDQIPFNVESSVLIEHIPTSVKRVDRECDDLSHALAVSGTIPQAMRDTQHVGTSAEFSLLSLITVTGKLEPSENTPSPYILTNIQRVCAESQGVIPLFNDKFNGQTFIWRGITLDDTRPKIKQHTTIPDILDNPQNFIGKTLRMRGELASCLFPEDQAYIVDNLSVPKGPKAIAINRRGILGAGFLMDLSIPGGFVLHERAEVTGQLVKIDHPEFTLALDNVSRIAIQTNPCTISVWNFEPASD